MEYDYEALHEDELTLRPGDIIKNVRYIEEEGWMEGDLNGKRGLFPDNFVKVKGKTFLNVLICVRYMIHTVDFSRKTNLKFLGIFNFWKNNQQI